MVEVLFPEHGKSSPITSMGDFSDDDDLLSRFEWVLRSASD
jgi:hypothetical protein